MKWKSRIFISFISSYLVGWKLDLGQKCSKVCIFERISSGLLPLYAPSDLVISLFTSHIIITYEVGQNREKNYQLQFFFGNRKYMYTQCLKSHHFLFKSVHPLEGGFIIMENYCFSKSLGCSQLRKWSAWRSHVVSKYMKWLRCTGLSKVWQERGVEAEARDLENILYIISYLDWIVISSLISW